MDVFKLLGKVVLDGMDEAKKELDGLSGKAESSESRLTGAFKKIGGAVITYFAKCDGELSDDESDILLETVEILRNNILLSDKAYEDIDSILDKDNFTFYQMCSYLDMLDVDELLTFEEIIENVISASDGISEAEEKAKDKFYAYLAERKAN